MADICGDDRFKIIERFKSELIQKTNIEASPKEMEVLDDILFRFWQMGWLTAIDKFNSSEFQNVLDIYQTLHKEREENDERIAILNYSLKEATNKKGVSEDLLLKVIEMFLQHPQTQQPCIYPTIPTTIPSSPFPPDVVYCNGVSGTNVKTE